MAGVNTLARLPKPESGGLMPPQSTQQRQNARRTSPKDAKVLSGHKRQKVSHSPEKINVANAPITQLRSQGSSSDQSANRWFDDVNQHVTQSVKGTAGYDDEPPFFMTHQNSYVPGTFAASEASKPFGVPSRLDSENEDLRGVIDDLTIENKRLKQILRFNQRSQRGSPSTETQDKLFEVRMHGLPSEKRRELEFLLKNFATSVHTSVPSIPNSTDGSGVSSSSLPANNGGKAKTDSGYASNSNSGQNTSLHQRTAPSVPPLSQSARDKSINKYLHDIPDTLMPRQQPMVMSERSRMALVVRRLEQLFTGRTAAPGEHSQPLQQQEVSQMAARADANNSKIRKKEGTREAHILPPDSKVNFDTVETGPEKRKRLALKHSDSDASVPEEAGSIASRPGSPDQRPTRPLDLDIHRAQVAAENIQYIRHLGLSSPHMDANNSEDSWMFLNLLINMAQLHTINVTPEFVRKAIKKVSTKFELSKDGHKVRWSGGPEGTVFSREEEKALESADNNKGHASPDESNEETGTGSSSKRSKTDSNSNAVVSTNATTSEDKTRTSGLQTSDASKHQISTDATSNQQSLSQAKPSLVGSKFDYKPIVYRERPRDLAEESYLQDSDSSLESTSRDSSGLVHALSRSNLREQRKADEGTITFYNNPFYCSDFSGDMMPNNMLSARDAVPGALLGIHPGNDFEGKTLRLAEACYFTPRYGPAPFRPSQDERLPTLDLAPLSPAEREEIQPLELPVSGVGGVVPDDNFAIDVDVSMVRVSSASRASSIGQVPLTGTTIKPNYVYQCDGCYRIDLLPSRLPPPNYIFFTSSSSSGNQVDDEDEESLEESEETSSSADEENPAPPSFLQHWSAEDSGEMGDRDDDDYQDDSSVDMLAMARAADPVRIAEQERQYVINEPGRAVAGSLAATVGASRSSSSAGDVGSEIAEMASDSDDDSDMEVDN